ncbi:ornithine decarboxylase [Amylibacter marinus]|uniref:ornithine decarboxylase n=1 Tax=Amylibacter marinus TaxID=1475483 RepID=A0ABQ5VRS8_9RHOB|nr:type III PLP-dependent enzyme [Amylibacter marinus]GLQ33876.1 ornithine decarboxylase [Amylibacter marinus]
MRYQPTVWNSPEEFIRRCQPERPHLFMDSETLRQTAQRFQAGFAGLVTYAVKANPDPMVLSQLINVGIQTFDVASITEIETIRQMGEDLILHYNNPVRSRDEIERAVALGVRSFSVDRLSEMEKLLAVLPWGSEVSVRLHMDVAGAAYDFGTKFGAEAETCVQLLRRAHGAGMVASMTFHPGTQCINPTAWERYIVKCAEIAGRAQVPLARLNVGGGFPSDRGTGPVDLSVYFDAIYQAVRDNFDQAPLLVCEPGRAMVAEAGNLILRVKARDGSQIFLNDGVYGGLAEFSDIGICGRMYVVDDQAHPKGGAKQGYMAFGPTCDSLDQLDAPLDLPINLKDGDYIIIQGMGAYVQSIATRFNGFGDIPTIQAL